MAHDVVQDRTALAKVLAHYQAWLKADAPLVARQLCKGWDREKIGATLRAWEQEQEWAFPLPESYFPLFERFNGQRGLRVSLLPSPVGLKTGLMLGSLDYMNAWRNNESGLIYLCKNLDWYRNLAIADEVQRTFWDDLWFPFAQGEHLLGGENLQFLLFIDLAPSGRGQAGQVVLQTRRTENWKTDLERRVIAPSLAHYFSGIVEQMHAGAIVHDPKAGIRHQAVG